MRNLTQQQLDAAVIGEATELPPVLALAGDGWGSGRNGAISASPVAVIVTVLLLLLPTGNLDR